MSLEMSFFEISLDSLHVFPLFVFTGNLRWKRPVGLNGCRETEAGDRNRNHRHHFLHRHNKNKEGDEKERHKTLIRAKSFGSPCFQVNPFTRKYSGSEDCLFLNVWTPSIHQSVSKCVLLDKHSLGSIVMLLWLLSSFCCRLRCVSGLFPSEVLLSHFL